MENAVVKQIRKKITRSKFGEIFFVSSFLNSIFISFWSVAAFRNIKSGRWQFWQMAVRFSKSDVFVVFKTYWLHFAVRLSGNRRKILIDCR